jgi:hypothetical protein
MSQWAHKFRLGKKGIDVRYWQREKVRMKLFITLFVCLAINSPSYAAAYTDPVIGNYTVSLEQQNSSIEVSKINTDHNKPPKLRVKILRKNKKPLEIGLKMVEVSNTPLHYSGQIGPWDDSHIGLQLEFSFDGKSWKRLGKLIKKVIP